MCLSHEGRAPMNGISALLKNTQERSPPLPPCEGTVRTTSYEPGRGSSPECDHLDLELP